jgi:hypothetical protein
MYAKALNSLQKQLVFRGPNRRRSGPRHLADFYREINFIASISAGSQSDAYLQPPVEVRGEPRDAATGKAQQDGDNQDHDLLAP